MGDNSMRDYGVAAPHGPNMTGQHVATADTGDMSNNEEVVFRHLLLPDDSYDESGTYWADMPIGRRFKFVSKVDNAEAKKELTTIGRMIKVDPLSPVAFYTRNMVIPGAGLLLEGYVLFSIGNLTPLFDASFKQCWDKYTVCNKTWVQSVTYLEVIGIIFGQILVGIIGDWIGRRWGLIQDCCFMILGLVMLIASWGASLNGWVIMYGWSLFVYSIGVGGEYPMTATSGMENAVGSGKISTRDDRLHRGRKVVSAFLMQGWGQFFNQVILILLLLIFHGGSSGPPYSRVLTQWTYRISFVFPLVGTIWLLYYRTYKMRSASKQLQAAKKKQKVTGYDKQSLKLTVTYFGPRLIATAIGWFANDVFFYGNKLFQSTFIKQLNPHSKSVMVGWLWNLINIGVELVGYYLASFLVDWKFYGRKWQQAIGFLAIFVFFTICAFDYSALSTTQIHGFQTLYLLSSFFGQFGPNCTTFLVAAEVFPTPVRASAHGFSAACGKLGALVATLMFNYITSNRVKFLSVTWFGLLAFIITLVFLPDTTGLDLKEQERRWAYIRAGREKEYHGVAVHPQHLSWWERWRGIGKQYNAEEDYRQRVEELRADWEQAMHRRAMEKEGAANDDFDDDDWSSEVSSFFERTRGKNNGAAQSPFAAAVHGNGADNIDEKKDARE